MAAKRLQWYELRPYQTADGRDEPHNPILSIMDHVRRFLLVLQKDSDRKIRTYIRATTDDFAALEVLDGIETVESGGPRPFERRAMTYSMRRHHAIPVADEDTEPVSMYRVLDADVATASVVLYASRVRAVPTIYQYIRDLETGTPPEGVSRIIHAFTSSASSVKRNVSAARRSKISVAKKKAEAARIFACSLAVCADDRDGMKAVEAAFPSMAFVPKAADPKRMAVLCRTVPTVQTWIGASRRLLLSDAEITSFIALPTAADKMETNMVGGNRRTYSSGGYVDDTDSITRVDP